MTLADVKKNYKTELCLLYMETGKCKFGDKCIFAHGIDEQREKKTSQKYKTVPCKNNKKGQCSYGIRCHFLHSDDDQTKATLLEENLSGFSMFYFGDWKNYVSYTEGKCKPQKPFTIKNDYNPMNGLFFNSCVSVTIV